MGTEMGEKVGWGPGLFLLCLCLLHPWDLLSFPVLGIADGKLQLFRVNAIVRQFQVLFSKYNLGKKKCASGSFDCQEG